MGSTWISSQPLPSDALVLRGLQHQPADVLLVAQYRARHVVEPLETEPAALVGRPELGRLARPQGVGAQHLRQVHAVLVGELQQRRRTHGAGEVQVQVRLGQEADVTGFEVGSGGRYLFHPQIFAYSA